MVNLMETESSTHNQVTYCPRNLQQKLVGSSQKSKATNVPALSNSSSQLAATFFSYTLNILEYISLVFILIFLLLSLLGS